jgi:iron complex outermembrane recepter protein
VRSRSKVLCQSICASVGVLSALSTTAQVAEHLEEITVTASKREQNLNDVGAAIAVISAADLKAVHVVSGEDVARVTPRTSFCGEF